MIPGSKAHFYLNPIAMQYLMAPQLIKVLIAGRGFGKSFVNGVSVMKKLRQMPRSKGLLVGETYTTILTNTLLPMKSAWDWFGYKDGKHYVVGKRPPASFKSPYQKPERYENVISWKNGLVMVLGSMDRPHLMRGANNDWSITDEALRVKEDIYNQIVSKTIRGSHLLLQESPGHLSEEFTSSMPYGTMGEWLLKKELDAKNPDNETFYIEGTSWDNVEYLTEKVLKRWKRVDDPYVYRIEVLNERIRHFGSTFYPSLSEKHWYSASYEYTFIDNLGFDFNKLSKKDSRWDKDCDPNQPLNISHDWGAFNCITIDQYSDKPVCINSESPILSEHVYLPGNTIRFINYMYSNHPRIHTDIAKDFCEYYKHHKNKRVMQYGDKSGNDRQANSKDNLFIEFADILRKNGWIVTQQRTGDAEHLARHMFINSLHREDNPSLPHVMYNASHCKDLRIALECAPMQDGKKDKRSEGNPRIKQEHATHGTDAHDYRLWFGFNPKVNERQYQSPVSFGS